MESKSESSQVSGTLQRAGLPEAAGLIFLLTGTLLIFALGSYVHSIAGGHDGSGNLIGTVGLYSAKVLYYLFGNASFLLPLFLLFTGVAVVSRGYRFEPISGTISIFVMTLSGAVLLSLLSGFQVGNPLKGGGTLGLRLGQVFQYLFGSSGATIIAVGFFISSLVYSIQKPIPVLWNWISPKLKSLFVIDGKIQTLSSLLRGEERVQTPEPKLHVEQNYIEPLTFNQVEVKPEENVIDQPVEPEPAQPKTEETPLIQKAYLDTTPPWFAREIPKQDDTIPQINTSARTLRSLMEQLREKHIQDIEKQNHKLSEKDKVEIPLSKAEDESQERDSFKKDKVIFKGTFSADGSKFYFRRSYGERNFATASSLLSPLNLKWETQAADSSVSLKEKEDDVVLHDVDLSVRSEEKNFPVLKEESVENEVCEEYRAYQADSVDEDEESALIDDDEDILLDDDEIDEETEDEIEEDDTDEELLPPQKDKAVQVEKGSLVPEYIQKSRNSYRLPLDILNLPAETKKEDVTQEIEMTRRKLEEVMKDYGISARVVLFQRGPIITLYEVKLDTGVKVSKILGIQDEIRMHLEKASVRIVAPIPGKSTIGIEIPNRVRDQVFLGEIIRRDSSFFTRTRDLGIILGKDIAGENLYVDLSRMPHLLVAGSTGAGKSVYMNAIIASLLYMYSPEQVRFIMVDPKMVELKLYEGIPHLLLPVITDVRRVPMALNWAVQEMEKRYAILSQLKCRDIRSYNDRISQGTLFENVRDHKQKRMPYIILFIDELSDLMMVSPKEVEDSIIRLTQKARAVGIHVVMATQRPSVDVITALIKANCPARISFHVAQRTDSRTILDANGAETLLGRGDMLYKSPTSSAMVRIQAPFISEDEIEKVVKETRRYGEPAYVELNADADDASESEDEGALDENSELFQDAWRIVCESGKTSTSYIQRRLRIGYNRAANIIERMEELGYLSPQMGNRPREILKRT